MADVQIKTEIKAENVAGTEEDVPHMIQNPKWKTAAPATDLQRVNLLEEAAFHGYNALMSMLPILKQAVINTPSAQARIEAIRGLSYPVEKFC